MSDNGVSIAEKLTYYSPFVLFLPSHDEDFLPGSGERNIEGQDDWGRGKTKYGI